MTARVTVYHGDMLDVLAKMPENSVDSVVCDPPYELSKDGKASAHGVFLEVMFPEKAKLVTKLSCDDQLSFLVGKVAGLNGVRLIPSPSAAMPESAVTLNHQPLQGSNNVENHLVGSVCSPDGNAGGGEKSELAEHLGCFLLELADAGDLAIRNALSRLGCCFFSGGFGVGFRIPPASLPRLLPGCGAVVNLDQLVGSFNNALPDFVGAVPGTGETFMPCRLNLSGASEEQLSTDGALVLLLGLTLGSAKFVRAAPGARGLPTPLQPLRFCVKSAETNRTLTFDLVCHPQSLASRGFMNKLWDGSKVSFDVATWQACLRVLKPGGHLLAAGGTRTYHRLTCAIEDAGFEIRDSLQYLYDGDEAFKAFIDSLSERQLELLAAAWPSDGLVLWAYGQGFPKSLDISKAIDKEVGAEREVVGFRSPFPADHPRPGIPVTAPATDPAKRFAGFGTALKPAFEPFILARKPLIGTVAQNAKEYGTGGLNIDASRVPVEVTDDVFAKNPHTKGGFGHAGAAVYGDSKGAPSYDPRQGRFPANLLHDGSEAVVSQFPAGRSSGLYEAKDGDPNCNERATNFGGRGTPATMFADKGSASRFFYTAKAAKKERRHTSHPTQKPLALMEYLVRLITPPGGTVLDPFLGSGTTCLTARNLGFSSIGVELDETYYREACARLGQHVWVEAPADPEGWVCFNCQLGDLDPRAAGLCDPPPKAKKKTDDDRGDGDEQGG